MRRPALLALAAGLALALAAAPLLLRRASSTPAPTGALEGTDARASALIDRLRPGHHPWARPVFEPPSREAEALLFALQAALGSGALGYCLGYARGRRAARR